ncbi:MAG: PLDc N-terminal domain-containing protein, partial [Microbacterium sp.]
MDSLLAANLWWTIAFLVDLAIKVAALILVPKGRKPTAAMAWLLAIFLIPYVGIVLFLLIGSVRLPAKRRREQALIDSIIAERVKDTGAAADAASWPRWFQRVTRQNEA